MKKSVLFITNIPAPYRIDFYNELGKEVDLTVLFEAKGASDQGIRFNYNLDTITNFKAVFLSEGNIREKKINWEIVRFLRKNKFDEIVVTSYSYYTEMIGLIYLKLHRIPYYMETDGGMIRKNENIFKRLYKHYLISGAKGYFSPSTMSDEYLCYYGADKEKIHRYPFTSLSERDIISASRVSEEQRLSMKEQLHMTEKRILLSEGRFSYEGGYGKGYDTLLKAAECLPKSIGFYIVGDEPTEEFWNWKKEKNLTNVHFIGFKNKSDLKEYYLASDAFILLTKGDVWGLVINEAMSYGLPIITTYQCVAGVELVQDDVNGYLVEAGDVETTVEKIDKIFNMEAESYEVIRQNNIKKMREYSVEKMAVKHLHSIGGDCPKTKMNVHRN